jgi:hypothetical protein
MVPTGGGRAALLTATHYPVTVADSGIYGALRVSAGGPALTLADWVAGYSGFDDPVTVNAEMELGPDQILDP